MPTVSEGDLVFYRPISSYNYKFVEGSIVLLFHPLRPKTLLIKRIHKVTASGIEIKGDNQLKSSDSRDFGLVNYSQIKGLVEKIIPLKL